MVLRLGEVQFGLSLYIQLTISFLIGQKRTVNFQLITPPSTLIILDIKKPHPIIAYNHNHMSGSQFNRTTTLAGALFV